MEESLSSIMTNETAPEVTPEPAVAEVKDDKTPEVSTEGAAAPSVAKEAIQPEAKPEPLTASEHAALVALKSKVKDLERQLGEKKPEATDFYTDPEKAVEERVQKAVAPIKERFFKQSVEAAAAKHSDFGVAVEAFDKLVSANPALHREWIESEDPGEFIYRVATNTPEHREKAFGDLKAQLADKDQKLNALAAEIEALKKGQAELAAVPKSLNSVASGSTPKATETEDESLDKIVRFKTG